MQSVRRLDELLLASAELVLCQHWPAPIFPQALGNATLEVLPEANSQMTLQSQNTCT